MTVLSHEPPVPVKFKNGDEIERLRVISIQDVSGTSLLFLANNFREAELLVCGLKLLLERETARLGVRGGLPLRAFGGMSLEGAMSPSAARGFRDDPTMDTTTRTGRSSHRRTPSEISDALETEDSEADNTARRNWGQVPGRNYMRGQAAAVVESDDHTFNEQGVPHFVHGQQIIRELETNVRLPLPLPLCRVLLLDSSSPVIKTWERDRGDKGFEKTRWAFPPATPRELERHSSEHQLIASGSMSGAHRTTSFDRPRYGSMVRLSETHTVEADDAKTVSFTVTEQSPRRGFSVKVRITLRAHEENSCDAGVVVELRPIGKNMSNQAAVHRAFLLLLDEVKLRYGAEQNGLLAGFLNVLDEMAGSPRRPQQPYRQQRNEIARPFRRTDPTAEEKKSDIVLPTTPLSNDLSKGATSGLVSLEDMLKTGRESPETEPAIRTLTPRSATPSILHQPPGLEPAMNKRTPTKSILEEDDFGVDEKIEPVHIEVKPLPKIRLSLMPSPREEDEEESSAASPVPSKPVRKKKSSRSRHNRRSRSRSRKSTKSR